MKKIFIHIGYNKTGTSSIQAHFNRHRLQYQKLGIYYPATGLHDNAHYGLTHYILGQPQLEGLPSRKEFLQCLSDEIATSLCDTILISSEYWVVAALPKILELQRVLNRVAPQYEVHVLVYLRRHDLWLESTFNQAEKTVAQPPWEMDIRDYVLHFLGTSPHCSYLRTMERWDKVFTQKNIHVRPFEINQFTAGSLITDFESALGCEMGAVLQESVSIKNTSLSPALLYSLGMIKRAFPLSLSEKMIPLLLGNKESMMAGVHEGYGSLKPAHRQSIYNFFLPEYRTIAHRYTDKSNGVLFLDAPLL